MKKISASTKTRLGSGAIEKKGEDYRILLTQLETAQRIARLAYLEFNFAENRFSASNEAYLLVGLRNTGEDLSLERILEFIHPDDRSAAYQDIRRSLREYLPLQSEYRIIVPDGPTKVVAVMGNIICDNQGKYQKFSLVIQDVTDMRFAQLALKESELRFRYLFDNSADGILLTAPGGAVNAANSAICELLGYRQDEILKKKRKDIFDFSDATFHEAIRNREENGKYKGELKLIHKDGHKIDAEVTSVHFTDAAGNSFHSTIIRDISEKKKQQQDLLQSRGELQKALLALHGLFEQQKKTENELRETADRLTQVAESISDGMFSIDENSELTYVNRSGEKILGISREELIGTQRGEVFFYTISPGFYERCRTAIDEKKAVNFEEYSQHLSKWFEVSAYPIGKGMAVYLRDITVRKREQLLLTLEKLVLERNTVQNSSLTDTINLFLKGLEDVVKGAVCTVMAFDVSGRLARPLAAPSLPENFYLAINPVLVRRDGLERHAMLSKIRTVTEDIVESPDWLRYSEAAVDAGLRSCWSFPIINAEDKILGSLVLYFQTCRKPDEQEVNILERSANFLRLLIENKTAEEKIRITNERFLYVVKASNEAIYDWDMTTDFLYWGEGFSTLFGHSVNDEVQNIGFWASCVHPEDIDRVLTGLNEYIRGAGSAHWEEEYRFRRADDSYAYVMERGYILFDNEGKPYRMVGSMQDLTVRKQLEKELLNQELNRQKLIAQAAIDAQEKERGQIGKELHDNINQMLTTTKLYLELAKTDEENRLNLINRSARNIVDTINEIRKLSRSLVPPSIGDLGLVDSITDLIESVRVTSIINIEFYPINVEEAQIEDNVKLMLFRVVQEQINNVLKHAKARNLFIELTLEEEFLELSIVDDGVGFEPDKVKRGLGLSNISSRANLFNGKVELLTSPGKGCKLHVWVPLDNKNNCYVDR